MVFVAVSGGLQAVLHGFECVFDGLQAVVDSPVAEEGAVQHDLRSNKSDVVERLGWYFIPVNALLDTA